jgi:hypothetical protein
VPATPALPADLSAYLSARDACDACLRDEARRARARASSFGAAPAAPFPSYPAARDAWRAAMLAHGAAHAATLVEEWARWLRNAARAPDDPAREPGGDSNSFGYCYYDATRVMYGLFDLTGDPRFKVAAEASNHLYRDTAVVPSGYSMPGYWLFPHGLAEHFRRTGDVRSRDAAVGLSRTMFAGDLHDGGQPDVLRPASMARENAYAGEAHLVAESLGEPHRDETDRRIADAFGHFDQWFARKTTRPQPFIVALACEFLIQLDAATPGGFPGVIEAVAAACDSLWATHWRADGSFTYIYDGEPHRDEPSHDLNLLIAPVYGWAYARTNAIRHRDRGDAAFKGGVAHAWFAGAKQFNQCARWSERYVAWRGRSFVATIPPGPRPRVVRTEVPFGGVPRSYLVDDMPGLPDEMTADNADG